MPPTRGLARKPRIAIIGAGPGALCMGVRLRQAGFEDFVLLEKGDGVGGTWHHNRYPGCACDIQSALYSFSFEIKKDWTRPYASQPEILRYMEDLARKYDLLRHVRFGAEVTRATWDESRSCWTLALASGDHVEAEIVVSALGMFNELAMPDLPGLSDFAGTCFHSARWRWDHDLAGRRVAVVGSAASAVQFVPEIAKQAGRLFLFQRTANWILPKQDTPYTPEELEHRRSHPTAALEERDEVYRRVDGGMTFSDPKLVAECEAAGLAALEVVRDPGTRAKLRPTHAWGCKRPLYSNDYLPAFNRPELELVTEPIERITREGVLTRDGALRACDTLILATGFAANKYLSAIDATGRDGIHIGEAWRDGAQAYLGVTTAGFPNLFMLYGPNTNNGSILTMIEYQVDYVLRQIARIVDEDLAWLDVRPDVMARYNDEIQQAIAEVRVWNEACNGYYRSGTGRVVTQWPHSMSAFRERAHKPDPEAYETAPRNEQPGAVQKPKPGGPTRRNAGPTRETP
ncbi:MAG: NAD(P)/FAD-dependent oxidoreductase [Deltaproteobacteria bacterium]|nr:NAD(P)/FAD-dependent oxidoreductase [Deltaproteobacteria bacterium]